MKKIISLLIFLTLANTVFAGVYTWNGDTSTSWTTASNWTPSSVPTATDTVIIESASNDPHLSANTSIKSITINSGTLHLNGVILTVTGFGTYSGGTVSTGRITQSVNGTNGSTFSGTTFNCEVICTAPIINLNGGTFNDSCCFKKLTYILTVPSSGGCIFNDAVTFDCAGSTWKLQYLNPDIFNGNVKATMSVLGTFNLCYKAANTQFNGNILLVSTAGHISLGDSGGTSSLASGKEISSTWTGVGTLLLKNFTQQGSTGQSLTLATGTLNISSSVFNGNLSSTTSNIFCKNSIFNGTFTASKSSSSNNLWEGGNIFNGEFNLTNSSTSATSTIRLASTVRDIYNSNVNFTCPTGIIQVAYVDTSEFKGNISISSNRITFNTSTGVVKLNGSSSQALNGNAAFAIKHLIIDNASDDITLNQPVNISGVLKFINGNIVSTSNNIVAFLSGSSTNGASDASFINGPAKKTGNTAFVFPMGKANNYRPISISAPSTTSTFISEFINLPQNLGDSIDTILAAISILDYWTLDRLSGIANVEVSLSWNQNTGMITFPSSMRVTGWNGTYWQDLGNSNFNGNSNYGSIASNSVAYYGYFALGNIAVPYNGAPNLNFAKKFALFAGDTLQNDSIIIALGKVSASSNIYNVNSIDSILYNSSGSYNLVFNEVSDAISYSNGLIANLVTPTPSNTYDFNSGIYQINTSLRFDSTITLFGDTDDVFIFRSSDSLLFDSGAVILLQGVRPENVFWIANSGCNVSQYVSLTGSILARKSVSIYAPLGILALFSLDNLNIYRAFDYLDYTFYSILNMKTRIELVNQACNFSFNNCNEIRNSTFDFYSQIPINTGELDRACPWHAPFQPNSTFLYGSTPDYFNALSPPSLQVPTNNFGIQADHSNSLGNTYSGILCRQLGGFNQGREYLQQEIYHILNGGLKYYGEFFVSLANKSKYSTNSIGMNFSANQLPQSSLSILIPGISPQINSSTQLNNFDDWMRIAGCFISDGTEKYVTIGNFNNNNNSSLNLINPQGTISGAYYYIDDPSIVPLEVKAGNDQTISCVGGNLTLGLPTCISALQTGQFTYTWSQLGGSLNTSGLNSNSFEPLITIDPNNTTLPIVQVYQVILTTPGGCTVSDEVDITVNPCCQLSLTAAPQYSCTSSQVNISASSNGGVAPFNYQWSGPSTGSASNQSNSYLILNTAPGFYTITVTDITGCSNMQTVAVGQSPQILLSSSYVSPCPNSSNGSASVIVMNAANMPRQYLWNTGAVTSTINGIPSGTYTVTVTNSFGCSAISQVQVTALATLTAPIVNGNYYSCADNNFNVTNINSNYTYSWVIILQNGTTYSGLGPFATYHDDPNGYSITFTASSNINPTCTISTTFNVYPCCHGTLNPSSNLEMTFTNSSASQALAQGGSGGILEDYVFLNNPNVVNNTIMLPLSLGGDPCAILSQPDAPTIAINGDFIVDVELHLINLNILMGPRARILVNPDVDLHICGCTYIRSCGNYMWDGIYTESFESLYKSYIKIEPEHLLPNSPINLNRFVRIEEALNAIVSKGSDLGLLLTRFNKNYRNIVISDDLSNPIYPNLTLVSCDFTCSDLAMSQKENIGILPHINDRTYSAIEANNRRIDPVYNEGLSIGVAGYAPLYCNPCQPSNFYNMDYGIRLRNCDALILNNKFDYIDNLTNTYSALKIKELPSTATPCAEESVGSAIYAAGGTPAPTVVIGSNYTLNPYGAVSNQFEHGKRGVYAFNKLNVFVYCNYFSELTYAGININSVRKDREIEVFTNNFVNCPRGMRMREVQNVKKLEVTNNKFSFGSTLTPPLPPMTNCSTVLGGYGQNFCRIENVTNASAGAAATNANIHDNGNSGIIGVNNGVVLSNLRNATVTNNTFQLRAGLPSGVGGIAVNFCSGKTRILSNHIIDNAATTPVSNGPFGVKLDHSTNVFVGSNTLENVSRGLYSVTSVTPNHLQCNEFWNNYNGIELFNSNIGPQGNPLAASDNQWPDTKPCLNFDIFSNTINPQNWYVQDISSYPWAPLNQFPFVPGQEPAIIFYSNTSNDCSNPLRESYCCPEYILDLKNEAAWFDSLTAYSQYMARKFAYEELLYDSSYISQGDSNDIIFKDYLNELHSSSLANLYEIEDLINQEDYTTAFDKTEEFIPAYEWESTSKLLYSIYLNTWAIGDFSFTELQYNTLVEIANLSIEQGGQAVLGAKIMLDMELEEEQSGSRITNLLRNKAQNSNIIKVYPNPASNNITFEMPEKILSELEIKLYDIYGKIVKSVTSAGSVNLDIENISSGIYYYKVEINNDNMQTGKVIILKK